MPQMIYKKSFRLCAHIFLSPQRGSFIPNYITQLSRHSFRKRLFIILLRYNAWSILLIKEMLCKWSIALMLPKGTSIEKAFLACSVWLRNGQLEIF